MPLDDAGSAAEAPTIIELSPDEARRISAEPSSVAVEHKADKLLQVRGLSTHFFTPDGVVQAMEVLTPPVGRRIAESIRQVQAYHVVRASGGAEVTPAGWMPGDPVLKPGPELVGNVWKEWKPNE